MTIGIFEVQNIVGVTMANYVKTLLDSFSLLNKVNELVFVVLGFTFHLTCPFVGSCFGHPMSKAKFNMLLTTLKFMLDFKKLV